MKIDNEILKIIDSGRTEENLYYLPPEQLDRKVYVEVNKVLEALGGKWNRQKKAHVFEQNIDDAILNVINTGEVISRKQELNFFETPEPVADQLCDLADLNNANRFLEPQAGRGRIIRAALKINPTIETAWCEMDKSNRDILMREFYGYMGDDFLRIKPINFPRICMNPPFSMNGNGRQSDIDHVTHALNFLQLGGILTSVMSPAIKFRTNRKTNDFRELIGKYSWEIIDLPEGAFKESGTMINTVILKVKN